MKERERESQSDAKAAAVAAAASTSTHIDLNHSLLSLHFVFPEYSSLCSNCVHVSLSHLSLLTPEDLLSPSCSPSSSHWSLFACAYVLRPGLQNSMSLDSDSLRSGDQCVMCVAAMNGRSV